MYTAKKKDFLGIFDLFSSTDIEAFLDLDIFT